MEFLHPIETVSELLESIQEIKFKLEQVENEVSYEWSDDSFKKYDQVQSALYDLCEQLEKEVSLVKSCKK